MAAPVHRVPRDHTRTLPTALHSGDPAYDELPGYVLRRLGPTLGPPLDAARSGEIRADIGPEDFIHAVALLCTPAADEELADSRRMVTLLIDGLRYGADRQWALAPSGGE
ncbi:MAG: hypothetical protein ACRDQ1_03820 [Sciscionella sp.]